MIELTDTNASEIAAEFVRAAAPLRQPGDGHGHDAGHRRRRGRRRRGDDRGPVRLAGAPGPDPRRRDRRPARRRAGSTPRSASAPASSGERALIRLTGEVTQHAESVVLPLLLPDSPVVVWWPGRAPEDPAADPLGALGTRRITDAASVPTGKARAMLTQCTHLRRRQHRPGLDPDHRRGGPCWPPPSTSTRARCTAASVTAERISPSADLLVGLARRPAQAATSTASSSQRPRHHRGGADHQAGRHHGHPLRRPAGDALLPRPARPAGRAQAPRPRRAAVRGAAPARPRRRLRRDREADGPHRQPPGVHQEAAPRSRAKKTAAGLP